MDKFNIYFHYSITFLANVSVFPLLRKGLMTVSLNHADTSGRLQTRWSLSMMPMSASVICLYLENEEDSETLLWSFLKW